MFCVLLSLVGVVVGASAWTAQEVSGDVDRVHDVFPPGDRPAPLPESMTFLLVGLDRESDQDGPGVADMVMVVHLAGDRGSAQFVSLPSRLRTATDSADTLQATFEASGAQALVGAVESLTAVRMDHYAEIDLTGFRSLTEALGGITVRVPEAYQSHGFAFEPGLQHFDGPEALAYMRGTTPSSDEVSSAYRQQAVIEAMFRRVTEQGLLSNVGRLTGLIGLLTRSLRVDDTMDAAELTQLAGDLRAVDEPDLLTAPVAPAGAEAAAPLSLDEARADVLWEYLREDTLHDHLDEFA